MSKNKRFQEEIPKKRIKKSIEKSKEKAKKKPGFSNVMIFLTLEK